ncbi:hypothetical protein NFI96_016272 [Prochilodus magdalenae]|nr:hypothetical protein NFI96_016272 [Prochilodus magdalenae]
MALGFLCGVEDFLASGSQLVWTVAEQMLRRCYNEGLVPCRRFLQTLCHIGDVYQMTEGRQCQVLLLDDRQLELLVQPKLLSRDLLDLVSSHFNLKEKEYFGISFTDETGQTNWLQLNRRVLEHDFAKKAGPLELKFQVRFYIESITFLKDTTTVELFYRNAKSSVYNSFISGHRTLPTGRCPQDVAHRTLPTGRCPQDAAPQDAKHRTLPIGHCPTGRCPTGRCPTGRCPTGSHRNAENDPPPTSYLLCGGPVGVLTIEEEYTYRVSCTGAVELKSENVFKLAAYVLQVSEIEFLQAALSCLIEKAYCPIETLLPCRESELSYTDNLLACSQCELSGREAVLTCRGNKLSCRETVLTCRGNKLSWREAVLTCRGNKLSCRETVLTCRENKLSSRETVLTCRENKLSSRETVLTCRENKLSCRETVLTCRENKLSCRETVLTCRGNKLSCRETVLTCRGNKLETVLTCRENKLSCRETVLTCRENKLSCRETVLTCRENKLSCRETVLTCRENKLSCRETVLTCRENKLSCRETVLTCRENKLSCRETVLTCRENKLSSRETILTCRGNKLSCRETVQTCRENKHDESARADLKKLPTFPTAVLKEHPSLTYCEDRVIENYRGLKGLTRGKAIVQYLLLVESLPAYGVHYYEVKDKQGLPWWLGISYKGIAQYDQQDKLKPRKPSRPTKQKHLASCVLWAESCGPSPVGRVLWAESCGPSPVGRVLWAESCGPLGVPNPRVSPWPEAQYTVCVAVVTALPWVMVAVSDGVCDEVEEEQRGEARSAETLPHLFSLSLARSLSLSERADNSVLFERVGNRSAGPVRLTGDYLSGSAVREFRLLLIFRWKQLENLYFREKKFAVEVNDPQRKAASKRTFGQSGQAIYSWYASHSLIKAIWAMAISQHQFYLDRKQSKAKIATTKSLGDIAMDLTESGAPRISRMVSVESKDQLIMASNGSLVSAGSADSEVSEELKKEKIAELKKKENSLQDLLTQKLNELKKICLREAELTGKLPKEYPLASGEKPPAVRRRVGTAFKLDDLFPYDADPHLRNLESRFALQQKIVEAAKKLANEAELCKTVKKKRRRNCLDAVRKLHEIENEINDYRVKTGKKPTQRASLIIADDVSIADLSSLSDSLNLDDDELLGSHRHRSRSVQYSPRPSDALDVPCHSDRRTSTNSEQQDSNGLNYGEVQGSYPYIHRDALSPHSSPYYQASRQPRDSRSMPPTPQLTRNAFSSIQLRCEDDAPHHFRQRSGSLESQSLFPSEADGPDPAFTIAPPARRSNSTEVLDDVSSHTSQSSSEYCISSRAQNRCRRKKGNVYANTGSMPNLAQNDTRCYAYQPRARPTTTAYYVTGYPCYQEPEPYVNGSYVYENEVEGHYNVNPSYPVPAYPTHDPYRGYGQDELDGMSQNPYATLRQARTRPPSRNENITKNMQKAMVAEHLRGWYNRNTGHKQAAYDYERGSQHSMAYRAAPGPYGFSDRAPSYSSGPVLLQGTHLTPLQPADQLISCSHTGPFWTALDTRAPGRAFGHRADSTTLPVFPVSSAANASNWRSHLAVGLSEYSMPLHPQHTYGYSSVQYSHPAHSSRDPRLLAPPLGPLMDRAPPEFARRSPAPGPLSVPGAVAGGYDQDYYYTQC